MTHKNDSFPSACVPDLRSISSHQYLAAPFIVTNMEKKNCLFNFTYPQDLESQAYLLKGFSDELFKNLAISLSILP